MFKCLSAIIISSAMFLTAAPAAKSADPHALQIDVPVQLEEANVVYNAGRLTWSGDVPYQLMELQLLAKTYSEGVKGQVVAVFHGDSGYLLLTDEAYNAFRGVTTGNPYKKIVSQLIKQGIQIEECGATASAMHWGNADLLPGVKVNTNAVVRFIQLEQEGYTYI